MAGPVFMLDIGPAGIVASHPQRFELPVLVAPRPEEQPSTERNTIRAQLVTIGCMRLFKAGFAFDSSVVGPEAERSFTNFAKLMLSIRKQDKANPKRFPPCSVFGHTDPTGEVPYNKTLSGRRARAVYAVLTRDAALWDELFVTPHGGDDWRHRSLQVMLKRLGFFDGEENGKLDGPTRAAVEAFQRGPDGVDASGAPLTPDGDPGKSTRPAIYKAYMNAICHDPDGQPFVLDAETDFIAQTKDKNLKGDVQGCGELNPIFLFSKEEEADFKKDPLLAKAVRDPLYIVNRRVVVYVFQHDTEIDPAAWPCPHSREDDAKCRLRLWSDHLKRRNAGPVRREFGENMTVLAVDDEGVLTENPVDETGNTMGCRFYHAFAVHSPCEAQVKEWVVRFKVDAADGKQEPVGNRRYVVAAGEAAFAAVIRGTTDANGEVRIPVLSERTTMTLKLDVFGRPVKPDEDPPPAPPDAAAGDTPDTGFDTDQFAGEDRFIPFVLDGGVLEPRDPDNDLAIKQRLYNLGFGDRAPAAWTEPEFDNALRHYKHRRGLDNADDAAVRARIFGEHDLEDPTPPPDDESAPTT